MTTPSRPNILLLMGDEHAPMAGSTWGGPARMPTLDALAAGGATFDAAYCNAPLCVPSRMSLLTGQFPHRLGVYDLASVLGSDIPTVAHALRADGYDAVLAGKMHFVGPDQLHGFRAQLARDVHVGDHPLMAWPDDEPGPVWPFPIEAGPGRTRYLDADDEVEQAAVDYIGGAADSDQPWFLCASFIAPHWPYVVPQEYWDQYSVDEVELPKTEDPSSQHPAIGRLRDRLGVADYDETTTRRARTAYRAALTQLDDRVDHILRTLNQSGQAESTLIVYLSDHGGMLGEHGLWRKMNFYEESARVPLILHWPGVVDAGQRVPEAVSLVDLAPTLLAAAGVEPLDPVDGQNLLPVLEGVTPPRPSVFSEYLGHGVAAPTAMLRRGQWKLVHHHGQQPQLFDLEGDPHELVDRASDPQCGAVLAQLLDELLESWHPDDLQREVMKSQARRLLIRRAEAPDLAPTH